MAGLSEGNIFHGEPLAPQMFSFRPAPDHADYRTPIAGYYQCGSGTHPGGCVTGAPGKLAAQRILRDRQRETVVITTPLPARQPAGASRSSARTSSRSAVTSAITESPAP